MEPASTTYCMLPSVQLSLFSSTRQEIIATDSDAGGGAEEFTVLDFISVMGEKLVLVIEAKGHNLRIAAESYERWTQPLGIKIIVSCLVAVVTCFGNHLSIFYTS